MFSECKTCLSKYSLQRYNYDPRTARNRHLLKTYGLTPEAYIQLFDAQHGRCAICGMRHSGWLDVDHNHSTGLIRGLLCPNCNKMIGLAKDDSRRLRKAAKYLASYTAEKSMPQLALAF